MSSKLEMEDEHHVVGSASHETEGGRVLKHADSFLIVDRRGEIQAAGRGEQGLYHKGTRHLSKLRVRFGKRSPLLLCSSVSEENLVLAVDLANPELVAEAGHVPHGTIHIARRALLQDDAYLEKMTLRNYGRAPVGFALRMEWAADFQDVFEVRGMKRSKRGELAPPEVGAAAVRIRYLGLDGAARQSELCFSRRPDQIDGDQAIFELALGVGAELCLEWSISCREGACGPLHGLLPARPTFVSTREVSHTELANREKFETSVKSSNPSFNRWLNRSRADLRMLVTETEHGPYPYAGVPWFSTVFGRDGIWTALEMLWVDPSIARGVLGFLTAHQADTFDAEADAEPGKIVHEMRDGEMAKLREVPFGRYYGSVDSTPLYLMLASAYHDATADFELIRRIWPNLLRALEWLDQYGDFDGDGFIEYGKRSRHGLAQQGWKDSHDSVFHADGSDAEGPIALAEVQAYAYAARRGMAQLATLMGDAVLAQKLQRQAEELALRFDQAFWCDELSMYALALDGQKRPCRVKTSNAGHCLYAGIALPERMAPLSLSLMSQEMFSGWGVRTLAADERRFNPMSYHNGSVWPHDNAIVAEGLARAGYRTPALALLQSLFDAASHMDFMRLPELFCGFTRLPGHEPIRYPVACLPQAWASGAAFSLLESSLGIDIDAREPRLTLHSPRLPDSIDTLDIERLRVGPVSVDLHLVRHPDDVGVTVVRTSAPLDVVVVK